MQPPVLPTSLVGSYPQPDWPIDRDALRERFPPRIRARELEARIPRSLNRARVARVLRRLLRRPPRE